MSEKIKLEVEFCNDEDHVYIKGKQYISLKRFTKLTVDQSLEMNTLNKKVEELAQENEAFRVLLKEHL